MLITITIKIMGYGVFGTKTGKSGLRYFTVALKRQESGVNGTKPENSTANAITVRI